MNTQGQKQITQMQRQQAEKTWNEKTLNDPQAAVCANCGTAARPMTMGGAILRAVGVVLGFFVIFGVVGAIAGAKFAHDNSLMLSVMFLVSLAFGWQTIRAASNRSCPTCQTAGMMPLSTSLGQRILSEQQAAAKQKE
jgi:membrane protease subunit (stomatin/prohibitin family)